MTDTKGTEATIGGRPLRDVMAELAAPLPLDALHARVDGKVENGRARFVIYTDAHVVRRRLDEVLPGAWSFEIASLPTVELPGKGKGSAPVTTFVFLATLGVLLDDGRLIKRSDVGQGKDYKSAVSDALKRVGVRWGVGDEIAAFATLWLDVEGTDQYAKPKGDWRAMLRDRRGRGERDTQERNRPVDGAPTPRARPQTRPSAGAKAITAMTPTARVRAANLREIMADRLFTDAERARIDEWLSEETRTADDIQRVLDHRRKERDDRAARATDAKGAA